MESFKFTKKIADSKSASSSLSEAMSIKGDHIVLQWLTEYSGKDLSTVSRKMRQITPKFDESAKFAKDVQVTLDENYLNYMLFTMFYEDKPFSLTEKIIEALPESFAMAGTAIKALMNTNVVAVFLPSIVDEFGAGKRVDLRCGFNKDYLAQAHL